MKRREQIANALICVIVLLLPWQTRWIFSSLTIGGEVWEYGKLSLYAVECLIAVAVALRGWPRVDARTAKSVRYGFWLLGAAFLSATFSLNLALSAGGLLHLVFAFGLFLLVLDERTPLLPTVYAFVTGLLVPSAFGWWQVLTGTSPPSSWLGLASHDAVELGASVIENETGRVLRAYGTFPHPNIFGGYLAAGLLLIAWLTRHVHDGKKRYWLLAPAAVFAATLVITFSRSGWIAAAGGFIVLFALMLWFGKMPPRRAFPIMSIASIAVLLTLIAFHNPIFTRFQPQARLEAKSIAERSSEYVDIDDVVKMNPFTGVGVGNYTLALVDLRPHDPVWSYQPIHNVFLLVLAEVGTLGLIVFVLWFVSIDKIAFSASHAANGMFSLALGTVLLIVALFDHYAWSNWAGLSLSAVCFALMLRWSLETAPVE